MASTILLLPYSQESIQAFRQYGYTLNGHTPKNPTEVGIVLNSALKIIHISSGCVDTRSVRIPLNRLEDAMLLSQVIQNSDELFNILKTLQ